MRVLVTGAAGFIGSHGVDALLDAVRANREPGRSPAGPQDP